MDGADGRGGAPWRRALRLARVSGRACGVVSGPSGGLSPRMRGNRRAEAATTCMRGNRVACGDGKARPGSIPAHAGEPYRTDALCLRRRVYPRACGGTRAMWVAARTASGLSPRMRGNHHRRRRRQFFEGSIPAHAGEPRPATREEPALRVYPRACGGTLVRLENATRHLGLSPRMRGNRCGNG